MRRLLLLTLAIIFVHGVALGQMTDVGSIDLFSDEGATSCNIVDAPPLVYVYVFARPATNGQAAAQFKIEASAEVQLIYVSTLSDYQFIGAANDNLSVAYGTCITALTKIATVLYTATGASGTCGLLTVAPANVIASNMIEVVTCDSYKVLFEQLGQARVNADDTCQCQVPVQQKTWGGIKALYD